VATAKRGIRSNRPARLTNHRRDFLSVRSAGIAGGIITEKHSIKLSLIEPCAVRGKSSHKT
jgi:hypothetical protein